MLNCYQQYTSYSCVYFIKVIKVIKDSKPKNTEGGPLNIFIIILKGILLAQKYEISVRLQKVCSRLCTTGVFFFFFIHLIKFIHVPDIRGKDACQRGAEPLQDASFHSSGILL